MQGIYSINNTVRNMVYVGSSTNITVRWGNHKSTLARGVHDNSKLQRSYNKYGVAAFEYRILEVVTCPDDLIQREQFWMDRLQSSSVESGFNLDPVAGRPMMGRVVTEETRQKISQSKKGQPNPNKGKKFSDEARANMSAAKKGKPSSFKGKKHSAESIQKLSDSLKGKPSWTTGIGQIPREQYDKMFNEETNRKRSETVKARKAAFYAVPENLARFRMLKKRTELLKRASKGLTILNGTGLFFEGLT